MTDRNTVEPRLLAFVEAMRAKLYLRQNVEKSDWRELDEHELRDGIAGEFGELVMEQTRCPRSDCRRPITDVGWTCGHGWDATAVQVHRQVMMRECADIANHAMMLWDLLNEQCERAMPKP